MAEELFFGNSEIFVQNQELDGMTLLNSTSFFWRQKLISVEQDSDSKKITQLVTKDEDAELDYLEKFIETQDAKIEEFGERMETSLNILEEQIKEAAATINQNYLLLQEVLEILSVKSTTTCHNQEPYCLMVTNRELNCVSPMPSPTINKQDFSENNLEKVETNSFGSPPRAKEMGQKVFDKIPQRGQGSDKDFVAGSINWNMNGENREEAMEQESIDNSKRAEIHDFIGINLLRVEDYLVHYHSRIEENEHMVFVEIPEWSKWKGITPPSLLENLRTPTFDFDDYVVLNVNGVKHANVILDYLPCIKLEDVGEYYILHGFERDDGLLQMLNKYEMVELTSNQDEEIHKFWKEIITAFRGISTKFSILFRGVSTGFSISVSYDQARIRNFGKNGLRVDSMDYIVWCLSCIQHVYGLLRYHLVVLKKDENVRELNLFGTNNVPKPWNEIVTTFKGGTHMAAAGVGTK